MRLIILSLLVMLSAVAGYAAQTAKITVEEPGGYYYWFEYSDIAGKQVTTSPTKFSDKKTTIELPLVKDAVPKSTLFVLDESSGNEAVIAVPAKPPYKFDLKPTSFDKVRRVEVMVVSSSANAPAAAAIVKLQAGDKKPQVQVLDPSAQGIVQFFDVPAGTVKVTVEYGEGKSTSQDVEIELDREQRIPRVEVPVVGQIEAVKSAPSGGEGAPATSKQPTVPINFPAAFVGLVLFAIILYAALTLMKNRGAKFREIMQKAGVDLPGEPETPAPAQTPAAAPADPTVCPFCGTKKDPATGACACSLGASPGATGASGSGPRLVAVQGPYMGSIYPLDADAVVMGREESNAIAFPQDSTVSRRHARIEKTDGGVRIVDEGSSNGTFVNGAKITDQVLQPGDEVQIGSTRLRFEM